MQARPTEDFLPTNLNPVDSLFVQVNNSTTVIWNAGIVALIAADLDSS